MPISQNSYYIELWEMFISQDNQESLSIIYKDHFDLLYNFGFKYTSDTGAIENSIQNIFGYFLKKRNKLGPVNNMSGYLIQCFRHELYLALKKQKKIVLCQTIPEGYFNHDSAQKENEFGEKREQLHQTMMAIIKKLNPKQQKIINLRFIERFSYKEISDMLNISVDSCYKSVYRSVTSIRHEAERVLPQKKK
jgi:RNA polymerase sigma factor (sigma-70 family)